MDETAKQEFIKNFDAEIETNKKALKEMIESRDKLAEDQTLSNKVHDLIIMFPKKLNPEYEFETRPEYWEFMKQKQELKKYYEEKRILMELDRLDKAINQQTKMLEDTEQNKDARVEEMIQKSESPKIEEKTK